MKLVPEHINEAIKHLTPKTNNEISIGFSKMTNKKIFDLWQKTYFNIEDEIFFYNLLKKRKAKKELKIIETSRWYEKYKYRL